jgi:hypothetical protein
MVRQLALNTLILALLSLTEALGAYSDNPAGKPPPQIALPDTRDSERAEIFSGLVNYCKLSLQYNSNVLTRCQLCAQWANALERKLRLKNTDFVDMRRQLAEPYIAGFQTASEYRIAESKRASVSILEHEMAALDEELPEFRAFFKGKIIYWYSQPPNGLSELTDLVSKVIPNKVVAQEIIDTIRSCADHDPPNKH